MKKVYLLLVCLCVCVMSASAQQGDQKIGAQFLYGNETNVGLGLKYRYNITDRVRVEPAFDYFFKHDHVSAWDLMANFHYLFPVADQFKLYPVAGLGYFRAKGHGSDFGGENHSDGRLAVNLGGGVDLKVSSNLTLDLQLKYQINDLADQLVLSIGASFAF